MSFCKACGARLADPAAAPGSNWTDQPWRQFHAHPASGFQPAPPPFAGGPGFWVPMMQIRRERVRQNLQPMGITWCLWGVYRLVMGAFAGFWLHAMARHHVWFGDSGDLFPNLLGALFPVIAVTTVMMAGLALLTGWGLLTSKPWARTLAIIMAILSLIKIPLGTALGIYTLWVLAPRVSGLEYDSLAQTHPARL